MPRYLNQSHQWLQAQLDWPYNELLLWGVGGGIGAGGVGDVKLSPVQVGVKFEEERDVYFLFQSVWIGEKRRRRVFASKQTRLEISARPRSSRERKRQLGWREESLFAGILKFAERRRRGRAQLSWSRVSGFVSLKVLVFFSFQPFST